MVCQVLSAGGRQRAAGSGQWAVGIEQGARSLNPEFRMKNKKANTSFLLTTGFWLLTTILKNFKFAPGPASLVGGPLCPPKVVVSEPSALGARAVPFG
jgi:hypothetical protein